MRKVVVLICAVLVLTGCLPFKQAEVYPTVVANTTVGKPWSLPVYVPPQQPSSPTVEGVYQPKPPTVNPYLIAQNYTPSDSWFPVFIPKVGQTWWIPRYDAPPISTEVTFWTGSVNVGVVP